MYIFIAEATDDIYVRKSNVTKSSSRSPSSKNGT